MKRIQGILSIIAFFIAVSVSAQNINKAEYFFDADPGVGNGTDIPLSIVGDSITLPNISAPTNSLTMGLHTLYVRVKDVTDKWSIVESTPFAITPTQNNSTQLVMSLDKAEYFFDTDPGVGNGIDLPLSMSGDSITVDNATITLNNLSLGVHQLYIRVRTSANRWSNVEVHPILVANTPTTNTVTTTTIDKAEYFVDTDPGVGNGIDFPLGSLGDTITVENGVIALNNLSLGVHQLYIRVRTSANRWSNVEVHPILIANTPTTNTVTTTTINKAEYFVDTDPGVGNGVDLPLGMVGDSVWVNNLNIQVGNLSNGEHQVYVRVRDVKGNWSTLANHLINIACIPSVSITASATTITAGTSVTFTPAPTNGGGNPTYIWKNNGNQVSTDATYTTTDLANGDVITCEMTSNASCVTTPLAISNSITMVVLETPASSLHFDGTNDYVTLPNAFALAASTGNAITIEYWFKGPTLQSALRMEESNSSGYGYIISGNDNGYHSISTEPNRNILIGATATDGNWHHIAMTWQRNTTNGFTSYLDGNIVEQRNSSDVPLPLQTGNVTLGSYRGQGVFMNGSLDEVRIWNRALPQCEIQNSMNCELGSIQNGLLAYYKFNQGNASSNNAGITTLTDDSGNGYHGTLNNFALTGQTSNWVLQGGVTTGISCPASDISLSIAITSGSQTTRLGTPVTFTATPTNVGVNPVYQWKKNNTIVQTNGTTYTDATLLDGDVITCLFTSTVCGLPQTVTSNSIRMTVLPDNAILTVGIALYPDPLYKDQLLVKIKPNLTVSNYPYSAGIFTVKFPTSYNTTLSVGSSTYGFTVDQSDATGSNTYYSFNYEGFSLVNWVADEEVTVAVLKHSGSCINPGVFEIVNDTWTEEHNADYYQELNGESAEGAIYQPIASISCMDIAAPTFTRPIDITINTAANCIYDASTTITGDVTDEADNCSTGLQATYTDVTTNGSCAGSKTIMRTWHLADACGNTTDKVQTITVQDKTAPTFTCPVDLTINTLADCTYDASLATTGDVTDEADNCSTDLQATYTDIVTNGSCTGSKTIKRTWHLADACDNSIDKVQTITVEDKTVPTFTRPVDITISTSADCTYDASLAATGDVTDEADNCSTGLQAVAVDFVANGSCYGSKTITRTWTLTDDCGNKTTKTQIITVIDNIKPTITAPSDISVNVNAAACSATVTLGTPTGVADNCTTSPTVTNDAPSVFSLGNTTVVWTVTDACGNTKTATQIVSVKTTLTPTNVNIASSSICSGLSTNLSFSISGGQSPYTVIYTEGGISQTVSSYTSGQNISVSPTATTTYTLVSVTDAFGCTKTATGLTTTLTVTPTVGTPTAITGPISVCQDDADATYSTTATNSVSITYSVSPADAGVINATTGVMNWATAFTGTATITATAMGCGGSMATVSKTVTVNPLPTLNIVAPNPVCLDFNLASLVKTFSPAGGSFSYHATLADANSNSNPINSLVTTTNTYYVRYTLPSGCFTTSSASVTIGACVTVNSKVMLQGPYNTTTQLMNDNLRANTLIPTSDPYSDVSLNTSFIPVNHGGIKTTTAAVLAVSGQNAIVDWVFLELRDITTNTQVVATRSALVQRDGDIVDMDGVSPVQFIANRAFYYLVVRHRNHLGIMSATPIDYRTGTAPTIDFTSLSQTTYGTNAQKQLSTGIMALWAGNANLQGSGATIITYNSANNDRVAILNRLSGNPLRVLAGYYTEDVNLDGLVKYNNSSNDRVIILNNLGLNPLGVLKQQIP